MTPGPGPNLFVVGAPKAGTTSLWAYLGSHPDVFMSATKEPHFFSGGGSAVASAVKEPAAYARLFADAAAYAYRGEASPSYLWDPETPARIRAAAPDARIVISLRDPVERAHAHYWTWVRHRGEGRSFVDAVHQELPSARFDPRADPPPYVARGFYDEPVRIYLETFGDATIVLFFEELIADVAGTMRFVFGRLGLDPAPADELAPERHYPFQIPRNGLVAAAVRRPGVVPAAKLVLRGRARERVERALYTFEKPPLPPDLRARLRKLYAPHDERLRQLLGRTLPWDGQP